MTTNYIYVFDAYGTLFDVHSAVGRFQADIGAHAVAMSDMWRIKQLEYTWTRTLMGEYRDFRVLTAEALDYAAGRFGGISAALREKLLSAYERLDAYPDAVPALRSLKERGARTAILSNGTPQMLRTAVESAGFSDVIDHVLSVDAAQKYKTAQETYALVEQALHTSRNAISFQSSNRWDIAGATKFGFRTVWINRAGHADEYLDLPPHAVVKSLDNLLTL
ncbi:MAG: haloacid dehalogenase type II [Methylobacteriaceae bacterium]|nr:haloacid dehalogenase type II [Methylobacteriaceae bacterium]